MSKIKYSITNVDEHLNEVRDVVKVLLTENAKLHDELADIRSEKYKDEELSRLKAEVDKLEHLNRIGFTITEEEHQQIRDWTSKHYEEFHHPLCKYTFYPCEIGTAAEVSCLACGRKFLFRQYT